MTRICACGCGESLAGLRADAVYASEACKKRAQRAASRDKAGTDHPLQAVRERQATEKRNRDLGGLITQAIVNQIRITGECHADDLIPLYPEGDVALCRHLAGGRFGQLAKAKLIRKDGWRETGASTRKGGGGWLWKFTDKGRAEYGISGSSADSLCPGGSEVSTAPGDPQSPDMAPPANAGSEGSSSSPSEPAQLFDLAGGSYRDPDQRAA